jgi:hypothetical protein
MSDDTEMIKDNIVGAIDDVFDDVITCEIDHPLHCCEFCKFLVDLKHKLKTVVLEKYAQC